ncbi:hypothetical protein ACOSQ3_029011 [Xanthoceras sorbifolium]
MHRLDLFQTLYVPYVSCNLVSLSKLDIVEYFFKLGNGCFSLFKHNHFIGFDILCDVLYKLKLDNIVAETFLTLHQNIEVIIQVPLPLTSSKIIVPQIVE